MYLIKINLEATKIKSWLSNFGFKVTDKVKDKINFKFFA